jgi:transcription elongation factor Elf1
MNYINEQRGGHCVEIKFDGDLAFVDGYKFRKDKKTGYYLSTCKIGTSRIRLHRYMWMKYHGEIPKGFEVHHKDGNKDNNEIDNLELMTKKKHLDWHAENIPDELMVKLKENLEKAREKAVEWHKSEEAKEFHRQLGKKVWEDRKPKIFTCKHCGNKFESLKLGGAKFCSPTCRTAFRVKSGVDDEIRECVVCGSKFRVNKYRKKATCSRSCASKLIHINRNRSS